MRRDNSNDNRIKNDLLHFSEKKFAHHKNKFYLCPKDYAEMKMPTKIILAVFSLLMLAAPVCAESISKEYAESISSENLSAPQSEISEIKLYVNASTVRVVNAAKQTMYVYSVTGECVARYRIDSDEKSFTLGLPKGIYILKVSNVARKISLR